MSEEEIVGYVITVYDQNWYLRYVLENDKVAKEAKITFLKPKGPSSSFSYPTDPETLTVPYVDILASVEVTTPTGRMYIVGNKDQDKASFLLKKKCDN